MIHRVLLIEDNPTVSTALKRSLKTFCTVEQVPTLTGAFNHVAETPLPYDAVIVDRVLPDGDGLEFLEYLREASPQTRICVFSSKVAPKEKIDCLQQGADCCLGKPMTPEEFRWHFTALLQREKKLPQKQLQYKDLVLSFDERCLSNEQNTCNLSKRELQVLAVLMRHPQGRATLEQLTPIFHFTPAVRPTAAVHVTVQRLRKKLELLQYQLVSLYGAGYQLIAVSEKNIKQV